MIRKIYFIFFILLFLFVVSCRTSRKATTSKPSTTNESRRYRSCSEKLNFEVNSGDNLKLYEFLADWYGAPYVLGGCTSSGTDCSCFVKTVYQNIYNTNIERIAADMYLKNIKEIKNEDLREGDLIFFKAESKKIDHVGLYLKNNFFIHASQKKGVIINSLEEPYYAARFFAAGRVK